MGEVEGIRGGVATVTGVIVVPRVGRADGAGRLPRVRDVSTNEVNPSKTT